jgi:hypothetical protein
VTDGLGAQHAPPPPVGSQPIEDPHGVREEPRDGCIPSGLVEAARRGAAPAQTLSSPERAAGARAAERLAPARSGAAPAQTPASAERAAGARAAERLAAEAGERRVPRTQGTQRRAAACPRSQPPSPSTRQATRAPARAAPQWKARQIDTSLGWRFAPVPFLVLTASGRGGLGKTTEPRLESTAGRAPRSRAGRTGTGTSVPATVPVPSHS